MNKKSIFLTLIIAIAMSVFFLSACNKDDDDDKSNNNDPVESENLIKGTAKDAISYDVLTDASVRLMTSGGEVVSETQVDLDGTYEFKDVANGSYELEATASGYKTMIAKNIEFTSTKAPGYPVFAAFLTVEESVTQPVSAVSGIVVDENFDPVSNAVISVSAQDEALTNGYFTSVLSSSEGFFEIGAIPLNSSDGNLIPEFKIRSVKNGFNTVVHTNIVLAENELSIIFFQMSGQSGGGDVIWEENFEEDTDWKMTGFWHRQVNDEIYNNAYPEYVKLAPNDNSQGKVSDAYAGQYAAWYGEASTGNFMGEPVADQDSLSGGTSMYQNSGSLVSPLIDLGSYSEASVSFWTWFEIESVNPNDMGFDIMEIKVIDASDTNNVESIGRLNPYSDPVLDDREALPYTSGGFNKAPVWNYQSFDLTDFAGMEIMLEFNFRTVDGLYNGFRGWLVDEIRVTDQGISSKKSAIKDYPADPEPRK
ncbi:MAG: carboxypeptidase regulatory-like domain-containing protein [Bacteroidota bacterium]|nr:carboxypeptidase regulatory-like domain-containing protein [Bacteroidota bacterium]